MLPSPVMTVHFEGVGIAQYLICYSHYIDALLAYLSRNGKCMHFAKLVYKTLLGLQSWLTSSFLCGSVNSFARSWWHQLSESLLVIMLVVDEFV